MLILCIATFYACIKDKPTTPDDPAKQPGSVHIEFDNRAGSRSFIPNHGKYAIVSGDTITFNAFKYYISNIELIRSDSSIYSLGKAAYLMDVMNPEKNEMTFDAVPNGDYIGIRFLLGLDSSTCATLPDTGIFATSKDMRFSDPTEPIFLKAEGTNNKNKAYSHWTGGWKSGEPTGSIAISLYKSAAQSFIVAKNRNCQVHLFMDALQLFSTPNAIDPDVTPTINTIGSDSQKLTENCFDAFSINHIHNEVE